MSDEEMIARHEGLAFLSGFLCGVITLCVTLFVLKGGSI